MRIVLVSSLGYPPIGGGGGVASYTRNMAQALLWAGHQVCVITAALNGKCEDQWIDGVQLSQVRMGNLHAYLARLLPGAGRWPGVMRAYEWGLAIRRRILKLARQSAVDFVQYPNVWLEGSLHPAGIAYAVRMNTPLRSVRQVEGCGDKRGWATLEAIERRMIEQADIISCHSTAVAQMMVKGYGVPRSRIFILPTPVDTALFQPQPRRAAERLQLFHPGPRLDDWQKGLAILLQAMEIVLPHFPDVRLHIAGRGEPNLSNSSPAVRQSIVNLGWLERSELAQEYARADLCIVPSLNWDTLPNVCLESLACATPVIGTAVGGIPDVIDHGRSGLIVPAGDAAALAQAIIRLIKDPEKRRQMGKVGRAYVTTAHCPERAGELAAAVFSQAARMNPGAEDEHPQYGQEHTAHQRHYLHSQPRRRP